MQPVLECRPHRLRLAIHHLAVEPYPRQHAAIAVCRRLRSTGTAETKRQRPGARRRFSTQIPPDSAPHAAPPRMPIDHAE